VHFETYEPFISLSFQYRGPPVLQFLHIARFLFLSWPIQRQHFVGQTQEKIIGQLASIKYSTTSRGGGGLTMTSYSNSLALVYNALGGVSQYQCVPSKTTTLVNTNIMDFFSHF